MIENGMIVYVRINSVSKSGLSRKMSFYVVKEDRIFNATYQVSEILKRKLVKDSLGNDCIRVNGAGMDMGAYMVDWLADETKIKLYKNIL